MIAQAAPKTQELADKINLLFAKRRRPKELEIAQLRREVKNLYGKIDTAQYYDFLGLISGLTSDKKSISENYENALKLSSNNYEIQRNYMVSLGNAGFISEEFIQANNLVNLSRNEESLAALTENTYKLCRFRDSLNLLKQLEQSENFLKNQRIIEDAVAIFNNVQLYDDEAQHLCQLAFSILEICNLYFSWGNIEIVDDCVLYTIYVNLPVKQLSDINWELAGIFAKKAKNMRSDVLMFEYSSIDILEKEEAYERSI